MSVVNVSFKKNEENLRQYATSQGMGFSDYVKKLIREDLERNNDPNYDLDRLPMDAIIKLLKAANPAPNISANSDSNYSSESKNNKEEEVKEEEHIIKDKSKMFNIINNKKSKQEKNEEK